ncbi:MAG: hypothetical protein N838_00295 [Thiohalocapsa sp. PB-PSB1]|nr:MAG: hypothetical protein N838_00295 [Thiohalocapsa sp. PB-PSB1]
MTGIEIGIEKTQHQGERNLMFAGRVFAGRMFTGRMFTGRAAFKEDESNFILVE